MSTVMTLPDIPGIIAKQLNAEKSHVKNIVELHKDGATIPFVSRYRKDQTGNMDEVQVTQVYDAIKYYNELFERKAFILEEIEKKGKLTPELREKIEKCLDAKNLKTFIFLIKKQKNKS
jgi:protein Tex